MHAENRIIVHHRRQDPDGPIMTRIIRDGVVALDPPGIVLRDFFPPDIG